MMKHSPYSLITLTALLCMIYACKKTQDVIKPTSSITIYNTMSDGSVIFPDFYQTGKLSFSSVSKGIPVATTGSISNTLEKGVASGVVPINFYAFPDSIKPLAKISREYTAGGIYSIFLCGTKTLADTLITTDQIPVVPVLDSVLLLRAVNLSKLTVPVSINLSGKTTPLAGLESLKYKQISAFLKISVKRKDVTSDNVILQVRNAQTGSLITSVIYPWRSNLNSGSSSYISKPATLMLSSSGNSTIANVVPIKL